MKVVNSKEKKYRKIKKALDKEFALHDIESVSNSEDEIVNTNFEIHPLSYYIDDRETLTQHLFAIMKGPKLNRLVPQSLKHLSIEELKADCLIQLLGLSKKRILYTMDDKILQSSSDEDSDTSDSSLDIEKEARALELLGKKRKDKTNQPQQQKKRKSSDKQDGKKKSKKKSKKNEEAKNQVEEEEDDDEGGENGKTKLIELIELEMRARAIRKLLGENDEEFTIKNEPNSDDDVIEVVQEEANDKTITPTTTPIATHSQNQKDQTTNDNTKKKKKKEELETKNINTTNCDEKKSSKVEDRETNGKKIDKISTDGVTTSFKKRIRLNRSHLRSENYNKTITNTVDGVSSNVDEDKKINKLNSTNNINKNEKLEKKIVTTTKSTITTTTNEDIKKNNKDKVEEDNIDVKKKSEDKEKKKKEKKKKKSKREDVDDILVVEDVKKMKKPLDVIQIVESDSEPERGSVSSNILDEVKKVEESNSNVIMDDGNEKVGEEQKGDGDAEEGSSISWQKRWLESKNVQKIVTTSKMCTNIRKRMRFAGLMKNKQANNSTTNEEKSGDIGKDGVSLANSGQIQTEVNLENSQSSKSNSTNQTPFSSDQINATNSQLQKSSTTAVERKNERMDTSSELEPGELED